MDLLTLLEKRITIPSPLEKRGETLRELRPSKTMRL